MRRLTTAALVLGGISLVSALMPLGGVVPLLAGAAAVLCGAVDYARVKAMTLATPWLTVAGITLGAVGFLWEAFTLAAV